MTKNVNDSERLWSTAELAEWLGVSPAWVRKQANCGEIPHMRVGRVFRFAASHRQMILKIEEELPSDTEVTQ